MRCPDCNKFVPYDTEVDPEESGDVEFDGETFRATFTRTLTCGECGSELKSAEIEIEVDATVEGGDDLSPEPEGDPDSETCAECGVRKDCHDDAEASDEDKHEFKSSGVFEDDLDVEEHEHEWEATVDNVTPETRIIDTYTDRKTSKVKKITRARYMTTEYGVSAEFSAECSECGAKASASGDGYVSASSMDELV